MFEEIRQIFNIKKLGGNYSSWKKLKSEGMEVTEGEDVKSAVGPVLLYTLWCNGH
jgi:hypothetical protein